MDWANVFLLENPINQCMALLMALLINVIFTPCESNVQNLSPLQVSWADREFNMAQIYLNLFEPIDVLFPMN